MLRQDFTKDIQVPRMGVDEQTWARVSTLTACTRPYWLARN